MNEVDLFGNPVPERDLPVAPGVKKKRLPTKANGYAGTPGRGPKDQKCKTCRHLWRKHCNKVFFKCGLVKPTCGPGTDIRANSPACEHWASIKQKDPDGRRL